MGFLLFCAEDVGDIEHRDSAVIIQSVRNSDAAILIIGFYHILIMPGAIFEKCVKEIID